MSEANHKLIGDIPRITHINLHNEYLKRKVVFINTNTILHEKNIVSLVKTQLNMYNQMIVYN